VTFVERASAHPAAQARLLDEEHDRFGLPRPKRFQKLVDRCVEECNAADFVRIPSNFARRTFLEEGFPEERLVQAPFGVDAERFTVHLEPGRFTVLYVGDVGLRKGALDLLEAWKRLGWSSDATNAPRLVFRGWVDDEAAPLIDAYRSQCTFETPGFTRDVQDAYADCTVFVLPSLEDGYPLVVLEAMASGRPVVVSENTGSKDAVDEGVSGFVVPVRSPDSIAERLQWLRDHPKERSAIGRAARQRALELPWERFGASVVAAHEEAVRSVRGDTGEDA
jgi:glycosyltransferase involved in cell wall biosynthesis